MSFFSPMATLFQPELKILFTPLVFSTKNKYGKHLFEITVGHSIGLALGYLRLIVLVSPFYFSTDAYRAKTIRTIAKMKRSKINEILEKGNRFIQSFGYILPPFAYWSPEEFLQNHTPGISENFLGWDITDYGLGKFDETGLFLFTVRNGKSENLRKGSGMLYAEKIMISRKNQLSPMHHHYSKTEDIINRGGGNLVLELYNRNEEDKIDLHGDVVVACDGILKTIPAGGLLKLNPGESVTLPPEIWHAFWAESDDVLIGEVSTVNDDRTDNHFREPLGRFSTVDEDCAPKHLLVNDYEKWLS